MIAASIDGRSTILNALPIRRAHPRFVDNLASLGAAVSWSDDVDPKAPAAELASFHPAVPA